MLDLTTDYIDSRDIIDTRAELEERLEEGPDALDDGDLGYLNLLRDIDEEGEDNISDWAYGETLIRDDVFVEYAEDLARDIGAVNPAANWPLYCIDWDRAARDLQADYTPIEVDGVTYWGRA